MTRRLSRAFALLLALAVAAPAPAQLLSGSLIVTVTSPASGSTVSGAIPVTASVSIVGSLTVSRVDFYVDGGLIGSDSTAPYTVSWDTRKVGNGSHTLTAVAQDVLGVRWTSSGVSVTVANDTTRPAVTINQAAGQADPTSASPINFTVVFSEPVSGFTGSDVSIGGTAGGTKSVSVTGGPSTYNAAVSGMTSSGTVIATVGAGVAQDAAGNTNTASTSTDNSVTWVPPDTTRPSVTINQATGQADPTSASPINFTAVFSEPVSGFTGSDVAIGGTAGATTATVSGGPSTYTVAVSGMTSSGTVSATIPAGGASDAAGNTNTASTSTDNSVQFNLPDTTRPTVTINQAAGQADPTSASPINFTVVFNEPVSGLTGSDVTVGGTAGGTKTVSVSGGPSTYNAAVSGMTSSGTVTASIAAGVASDAAGNTNTASTSTDNTVTFNLPDTTAPTVSITSPADGATVSGTINVAASASDNVGVVGVEFLLDGVVRADDTSAPYSIPWDTTTVSDGSHTITAIARDAAGNRTTSAPVTVTVSNGPPADTTPPSVSVTSPADGATVSGTITVSASATDNVGVTGVQFQLDGAAVGPVLTTAPYELSWDTTTASDGTHTISAVARDAAGNSTTSAPVSVTVSNAPPADTTPPAISITSPADGATVSGTITVSASASDNVGVASVQFRLDGADAGPPDTSAPYSMQWDTTTVSGGAHALTAIALDATGNATTSAPVAVTVANGGPSATRFEEDHSTVSAAPAAAWLRRGPETAAFSGGTAGSSDAQGATVTFSFNGTGVSWIGLKCSACGIATVSIDGEPAATVDTAGPAAPGSAGLASEPVFSASGLAAGDHSLLITVTGTTSSSGAHVIVDAFDVTGGSGSAATRIEETGPGVSVAGPWSLRGAETAAFSGGAAGSSDAAGASLTLDFTGTAVSWIGLRCSACGIATVSIDGGAANAVDTAGAAAPGSPGLASEPVFSASGLAAGGHRLVITVTGTTSTAGAHVVVDAFDVTP